MTDIIHTAITLRTKISKIADKVYLRLCENTDGALVIKSENDDILYNYIEENGIPNKVAIEGVGCFQITKAQGSGRLFGKVAVITGGAQGFGYGLAQEMAKEGAAVVIADINYEGAVNSAKEIKNASGIRVDVTDEQLIKAMCKEAVLTYGGIDIMIANAGIAIAGGLDDMTKDTFEKIAAVNYTSYFLCVKYASQIMKLQHEIDGDAMFDIIQINSKSGIAGSNKNFAYSGSKFGGIGLTQSFALELAPYNIKVNAVCPGNFLDGPLWSDPQKGLLVQFLNAGKIPGAKTVDDVRKAYESKVPLGRGCRVIDVARAVFYICEQEYETGQAIPVTGGQEMLN